MKTDQEMKTELFDENLRHIKRLRNMIYDNLTLSSKIIIHPSQQEKELKGW